MDELERDLRATLGNLADGARSSDELVDTTIARSAQIRRRRRTFAASAIAAVALVVAIAVASIAGAGTHGTPVRVADPGGSSSTSELTSTTTTTTTVAPTTTTTPAPTIAPRPGSVGHQPGPGVDGGPVTTTTVSTCDASQPSTDPFARSGEQYTPLPNGDIEVSFGGHPFGPARESYYYLLDDGTTHWGGFAQTYSPDRFGTHWFDLSTAVGGMTECLGRVTFTVGTDMGSTTSTTDTTIGNETTTTAPETTTSTPN